MVQGRLRAGGVWSAGAAMSGKGSSIDTDQPVLTPTEYIPWEAVTPRPHRSISFAHGDACRVVKTGVRAYFCKLCDAFAYEEHFASDHHWWEHISRYADSLYAAVRNAKHHNISRAGSPDTNWIVQELLGGGEPQRPESRMLLELYRIGWGVRCREPRSRRAPAPVRRVANA